MDVLELSPTQHPPFTISRADHAPNAKRKTENDQSTHFFFQWATPTRPDADHAMFGIATLGFAGAWQPTP